MRENKTYLLKGTLDVLVLKVLALGRSTGWAFQTESRKSPKGFFKSNPVRFSQRSTVWRRPGGSLTHGGNRRTIAGPSITV
jgi:hypothetical protein